MITLAFVRAATEHVVQTYTVLQGMFVTCVRLDFSPNTKNIYRLPVKHVLREDIPVLGVSHVTPALAERWS